MIDFTDAAISATEPFTVPASIFEEVFAVCEKLGVNVFSRCRCRQCLERPSDLIPLCVSRA